jgi:hypothetical protein
MDSRLKPSGALPTFFIIGAPAAGTTSLHYYLDQHPQIQMSASKEPGFFAPVSDSLNPSRSGERYKVEHLDQYERLFDPVIGVRGEATVDYANYPRRKGVPGRIKKLVPDAKFIYLVRDPIARTVSHYQHRVAEEGERRSMRDALGGDVLDPSVTCICASLYASQLDLYLGHFARERILVIDQADLLSDRRSTLSQIFAFLSVDDAFNSSRFDEERGSNRERRIYPAGYARLRGPVVPAPLRWVPRRIRRPLRLSVERILWPSLETPVLDDELREQLEELYSGEVERLRALTGKTFSTWSI